MPTMPGTFRPPHARTPQETRRESERRRGSARERGYSSRWDATSKANLRLHPLCVGCAAVGRVTAAEVTDHAVPHEGDEALFWDPDNWQSACRWHHDVVKQKLEARWRKHELPDVALRLDSPQATALTLTLDPA